MPYWRPAGVVHWLRMRKRRVCSHQEVAELQFNRFSYIEIIIWLLYKKEKQLAVVLILATPSIVSPTKCGDRVIDYHGQDVYQVLETVGWNWRSWVWMNEIIKHSWGPRQTRRNQHFRHNPWNIRVVYCIIERNFQVVRIRRDKPDAMFYNKRTNIPWNKLTWLHLPHWSDYYLGR